MTYASALSKLSLTTPVTLRMISKLSVASVKIRCEARSAALADTASPCPCSTVSPCRGCVLPSTARVILGDDDGDGARELGPERTPGSGAPVPRSLCAARRPPTRRAVAVPCPATPRAPVAGAGPALVAQRCGSLRINPRTRLRAGSGRAPPAYLLTTSTTCLMVCTISRRTSVSLRICSSDMGGRRVVERLSEGMGWRLAVKSRRIRICASIWAVAY